MQSKKVDVAIVGAGIIGLAHAYLAARSGRKVAVFERSPTALGASIRNFGMIWPIGQPAGSLHAMALRSREIWLELLREAGWPFLATGSLARSLSRRRGGGRKGVQRQSGRPRVRLRLAFG